MKIKLSGLGWFIEQPGGNRLLWSYPCHEPDGHGGFLGLPDTIIVERASLTSDQIELLISKETHVIPVEYGTLGRKTTLNPPVQALAFVYRGENAIIKVYDSLNRLVAIRTVEDGNSYFLSGAEIQNIFLFYSPYGYFESFQTLCLSNDLDLAWIKIATIGVKESLSSSLEEVKDRYAGSITINNDEWEELREQARDAQYKYTSHNDIKEGEGSPWQPFYLAMNSRWEYAVLLGHGFFDGPHEKLPEKDTLNQDSLLKEVSKNIIYAYRIKEDPSRAVNSNIAVCFPTSLSSLSPPEKPQYLRPEVRLEMNPGTNEQEFIARYDLKWQNDDENPQGRGGSAIFLAGMPIGVEIVEEILLPGQVLRPKMLDSYLCRSRLPDDPLSAGTQSRQKKVPDYRIKLRCKARAIDGWDRVGDYSEWSDWISLKLYHDAPAPDLTSARHLGGRTFLTRQIRWKPDMVVKSDITAKLLVYRRKLGSNGNPITQSVILSDPVPVLSEGNLYTTSVTDGTVSQDFLDGYLLVPPFSARIRQIHNNVIEFTGSNLLFGAGSGKLRQDPNHQNLWEKVAEFPANSLPPELEFKDHVPMPAEEADVLSYFVKLSYLGLEGTASNIVQAFRIPAPPEKPELFDVKTLGIDFYRRTLIKIIFRKPVNDGAFTVWWADSEDLPGADFEKVAVPGEYRSQPVYKGLYLFDVLSIPVPEKSSKKIVIGVQQVNNGGGQSEFQTSVVELIPQQIS